MHTYIHWGDIDVFLSCMDRNRLLVPCLRIEKLKKLSKVTCAFKIGIQLHSWSSKALVWTGFGTKGQDNL